ncbi:hypothetical protein [Marinobacterium mangrovicola]|uniref:Uncharacterized protein n=1 Tax=Marinobacterium mangrovicola TaxID=1476959 RepID=A0A4R1GKM5_9GAMM|nr:hypothetical protein [Marinobacterium mangrovicola]TCK08987.1 hypothetical protein CLV83_1083 [Marinobacterium mangrovicola]
MKDIIDAVSSRIKTPYFGYAILAFIALNWRGIFLLVVTNGTPNERLNAFDSMTSYNTLVVCPLLVGALVAASSHWVQYLFGIISRKPSGLIDNLYLEAEHKKTIREAELEQSRSDLFAVKEKELIERAKRDEEVAGIEDDAAKERLSEQIESLRRERDQLSAQLENQSSRKIPTINNLSSEAIEIIKSASQDKSGKILKPRTIGERSIQVGRRAFGSENPRDFARYDAALEELISGDLVKGLGGKGEVFELTHKGWQVADSL